jgi:hypothetical protein
MKRSSGKTYLISLAFILISLAFFPHSALATEYNFTPINVTGSFYTSAYGINNSGNIMGVYGDATGGARLCSNSCPRTLHFAPPWLWSTWSLGNEEEVQKVNPYSQSMEI